MFGCRFEVVHSSHLTYRAGLKLVSFNESDSRAPVHIRIAVALKD